MDNQSIKKIKGYLKENKRLLKKYRLIVQPVIHFPTRARVPFLSKIALWIIRKQGATLDIKFDDLSKK